jgi:hypothetical protein
MFVFGDGKAMSDYLSNLVDRSLDRADVVQPRLPSLFEPTPAIGNVTTGLWQPATPAVAGIEESITASESPDLNQPDRQNDRSNSPNLNNQLDNSSNLDSPRLSLPTIAEQLLQPFVKPLASIFAPAAELPPPPVSISEIQPQALPTHVIEKKIIEKQITNQVLATEQTNSVSLQPAAVVANSYNAAPAEPIGQPPSTVNNSFTTEGIIKPIAGQFNENPALNPVQPDRLGQDNKNSTLAQVRSAIQILAPEVAPSSPSPVIQVSIGRIEVRATTSAAPVATPRSRPTTMSLDEYLRQRGGSR